MLYLRLHLAAFDALLLWAPWGKVKSTGQSWHLEQTWSFNFESHCWAQRWVEVFCYSSNQECFAIFIMHWGLSWTEATPNFFLRQECRHQLMYGPKLILFPPERPLGQAGGLFLAKSHMVTHSQTCQPPWGLWSGSLVIIICLKFKLFHILQWE